MERSVMIFSRFPCPTRTLFSFSISNRSFARTLFSFSISNRSFTRTLFSSSISTRSLLVLVPSLLGSPPCGLTVQIRTVKRMGVLGLSKLIADEVPGAVKETEMKSYFGRRIAVDASMSLYQFLIAIRFSTQQLTNDAGETTSHLTGFFYRTVKMLEAGIKPVFVFDGKPPDMKLEILRGRKQRAEAAKDSLAKLIKDEDLEVDDEIKPLTAKEREAEEVKLSKRTVRMTGRHNDDVKRLLRLLGVPIVEAPAEAESQCAQLCKEGLVYGVATEDVDVLTFGAPKMIRHMTNSAVERIKEIDLQTALNGLELTQEQLVDLSILLGCDYCPSIRGIGPKKGLELLRSLGSIEKILVQKYGLPEDGSKNGKNGADVEFMDTDDEDESEDSATEDEEEEKKKGKKDEEEEKKKGKKKGKNAPKEDLVAEDEEEEEEKKGKKKGKKKKGKKAPRDVTKDVPDNWRFKEARKLFIEPEVKIGEVSESDLKIRDPDEEGLIQFLCKENQFDEERVKAAIRRVVESKGKASQTRIDSFFTRLPSASQGSPAKKGKVEEKKNGKAAGSKAKGAAGKGKRPK